MEISAKTNEGVPELLDEIVQELDRMSIPTDNGNEVKVLKQEDTKKTKCCGKT